MSNIKKILAVLASLFALAGVALAEGTPADSLTGAVTTATSAATSLQTLMALMAVFGLLLYVFRRKGK